ncbi:MAG: hypothetical protein Fur005_37230 [Roseiflexaceae bacterium]
MQRRIAFTLVLALIAGLFPFSYGTASAATFRSFVAQVPAVAGTGSVRIWMNSDTAFGETAGIETLINGVYTKRLGSFDTSYPGANWRVDIPGQAAGTTVQYQLFTRNQSGSDYGFTGFNWSYTVSGQVCAGAVIGDNNILYGGLFHDSFDSAYRNPTGPVASNQGSVTLKLRTCQNDAQSVSVRVWNDRTNTETISAMALESSSSDATLGPISIWSISLPIPSDPTALYYSFRASDGTASGYYRDDDPKFLGGGFGVAEANQNTAYDNSYQISVFDPAFFTPEWMQRGIIYQIFPDRFRDGNAANNPTAGQFSYGGNVAIVRSNDPEGDWNSAVCDPRAVGACFGRYGDNFYGGDLQGITQKISDGYFSNLGVTIIYLNPIFRAPSNHKYDTANFLEIDPEFGTLADFQAMVAAANARGIRIMLDGVFNHTSSDSPYFDRYQRYDTAGQLTAPNGGANDGSGACEAVSSTYRSWFYFPAIGNSGKDGSTVVYCADASGNPTVTYEAWYGYSSLPKIQSALPQVRQYFYGNSSSVGPYWTGQGASGWRFDVGADVDPGLTNDPSNDYWEGFRAAVRNPSLSGRNDTVMLGEEWGDATPWLLGNEWDSVMNYRFRSAVLSWLFTGCTGNGCTGGTKFQENDSNDNSSSGAISALSPSQFNARLRSIHEDYPPNAFKAMMNLAGSHDTQRLRFLLKKINNDNDAAAVQRMKEWWLFAFTYAGNPTLYYGDEIGLSHDGVWDGSQYQDDPYNRTPYPWPDASGSAYVPDTNNLLAFARHMASIRQSYRALQDGDVQHGLVVNDAQQLYGYARTNGTQTALILLNRGSVSRSASFSGLNAAPYNLPDGTVLIDVISGASYSVTAGAVNVTVAPTWGAVLLEQSKIDAPAAAAVAATGSGSDVQLSWPAVTSDSTTQPEVVTSYAIHRSTSSSFVPGPANLIATTSNPNFGGDPSYTDLGAAGNGSFYIVRACNAAGVCSQSAAMTPALQNATLSTAAASGSYAGSVTLSATLSASSGALAGRTISFALNGSSVGSASTNASGVASVTVSLSGIDAGSYANGVEASFAGDSLYNPASANAALEIARASATITLGGLSTTYDGTPKVVTATTSPAGLNDVTITYDGASTAPSAAGSYTVVATLDNPNYTGSATGTLVIAKASATITLSGLSATYDGTPKVVTATTSPAGLNDVTITYDGASTAPSAAGSYAVVATLDNPNYTGSATGTLVIGGQSQTITFATLANRAYSPTPFTLSATASSSLPVSFSASGACTVSGNQASMTGVGSCSITASQAGGSNYAAASDVTRTFTISKANQTISFATIANRAYSPNPFTINPTASSGLPVSLSITGPCSLSGTQVTMTGVGSCSITASQAGNANYNAATSVTRTFTISKANQTLTFATIANRAYSPNPFTINPTASSSLPVSLSITGPCSLSGTQVTMTGVGSCSITASQAGNANYNAATSVTRTFTISKASQTITFATLPGRTYGDAPFTVSATASSGLPVSFSASGVCSISGTTVTINGAGTCSVIASQAGDANYNAASNVTRSFAVVKAPASVSIANLSQIYNGTQRAVTVTTDPAGLTVRVTYNGSTTVPTNAGSYAVMATINNANYQGSASATLVVAKIDQTITFGTLANRAYSPNTFNVSATASSRLTVSFSASGACTVSGRAVTMTGVGICSITASQAGNTNYNAATSVTQSFTISKANQTISFAALASRAYSTTPFTVSATASSGLPVSFSASGACTVSGNQVTMTGTGSCSISASQPGNDNYNAATTITRTFTITP